MKLDPFYRFKRSYSNSDDSIINEFWDQLYRDIEVKSPYKGERYNTKLFQLLDEHKKGDKSYNTRDPSGLGELQMSIEDLTIKLDESSILKDTPNLIRLLIGKDLISAKSYLYKYIPKDIFNSTIAPFGEYTLEAIIIYVLGVAYHSIQESSVVRVSTLLGMLDRTVITQANIINKNDTKSSTATSSRVGSSKEGGIKQEKGTQFEIGRRLLEFMIERDVIHIVSISAGDEKAVVKEKEKAYIAKNLFAVCNFDLSTLPMKLNLPMVCEPLGWRLPEGLNDPYCSLGKGLTLMLSDLRGGYLSSPPLNIYYRMGPLSSRYLSNFNIELSHYMYKEMCSILDGLQKQGFKVNINVLEFIKKNRPTLKKRGASYAWKTSTRES